MGNGIVASFTLPPGSWRCQSTRPCTRWNRTPERHPKPREEGVKLAWGCDKLRDGYRLPSRHPLRCRHQQGSERQEQKERCNRLGTSGVSVDFLQRVDVKGIDATWSSASCERVGSDPCAGAGCRVRKDVTRAEICERFRIRGSGPNCQAARGLRFRLLPSAARGAIRDRKDWFASRFAGQSRGKGSWSLPLHTFFE